MREGRRNKAAPGLVEEGPVQAEDSAWDASSVTNGLWTVLCTRVSPIKMGTVLLYLLRLAQIFKAPQDTGATL